eukprot:g18971.t1
MDSYVNRLTTIFYTFVTAFGMASISNHLSSYCFYPNPKAALSHVEVQDFTLNNYLKQEQATLSFDIEADFTSEFHWNQKQLFVYVLATYESESNELNEVIVWDDILRDKEDAVISKKNLEAKYPLRDQGKQLKNKKGAKLVMRYRTMPIIGLMDEKEVKEGQATFDMPSSYFRKK